MFDEQKILSHHLHKIHKQTHLTTHYQSTYNDSFDRRLKKLVLTYKFNFQAIALHLTYQFPQFQYKIKKEAVAFRWYQLDIKQRLTQITQKMRRKQQQDFVQYDKERINEFVKQLQTNNKKSGKLHRKEQQSQYSQQQQNQQKYKQYGKDIDNLQNSNNHKSVKQQQKGIQQLQKALNSALMLSEETEQEGFMIYKPKYERYTEQTQEKHKDVNSRLEYSLLQVQVQGSEEQDKQEQNKQKQADEYEYGYNYSVLQQEYNHYNTLMNSYGLGFHDESPTNSSIQSSSSEKIENQIELELGIEVLRPQFAIPQQANVEQIKLQKVDTCGRQKEHNKQDFQIHQSDYESD